mgnify:CR=1 FL=1
MKKLILAAAMAFALATPAVAHTAFILPASFWPTSQDLDAQSGFASTFFVSDVASAPDINVIAPDGSRGTPDRVEVTPTATNIGHDLLQSGTYRITTGEKLGQVATLVSDGAGGWRALAQGERIYSLGNPLDVGFAVMEGNYNGLVKRSFYPQIFFGGALSGGMSGGPALDQDGQVIGVNVARRVDGEQVSFLVPSAFVAALLSRAKDGTALKTPAHAEVAAQLQAHQAELTERFIAQGWKPDTHPRYRVPVPQDGFMRCWGGSEVSRTGGLDMERSDCVMDTHIFAGEFNTGAISVRHESYDGSKLGALRFAAQNGQSFRNESFTRLRADLQTRPQCHEDFLDRDGLTLRAVACLRAYKKLPGLYDLSVLVATLDQPASGVQGRFDVQGVSFDNAQRLARHYLQAYERVAR